MVYEYDKFLNIQFFTVFFFRILEKRKLEFKTRFQLASPLIGPKNELLSASRESTSFNDYVYAKRFLRYEIT